MRFIFPLMGMALLGITLVMPARAEPIAIVAAENFYGDVATQIGGAGVYVTSILSSPDQDPHLFEASPSTARLLAVARIAIANGADYDPWMEKLLVANRAPLRTEIIAASLVNRKAGDNPHLWYETATMIAVARQLNAILDSTDNSRKEEFDRNTSRFIDSVKQIDSKVAQMKLRFGGMPVTASEPVFGYMAQALGLKMQNQKFQIAIQNNAEPSISEVAAFERDLKGHKVKVMIYNSQASEPTVQRLVDMAKRERIPVVGITETQPAGKSYQEWMISQLDALETALSGGAL